MNSLRLEPMTESQFQAYFKASSENYARTSPNFSGRPFAEALAESQRQMREIAPQGPASPGQYLFTLYFGETEAGYLHLGDRGNGRAYIWNFEVSSEFRGRGLGRRAIELATEFARGRGFAKLGLNVFADNEIARKLYDSEGFVVIQMNMEKTL